MSEELDLMTMFENTGGGGGVVNKSLNMIAPKKVLFSDTRGDRPIICDLCNHELGTTTKADINK